MTISPTPDVVAQVSAISTPAKAALAPATAIERDAAVRFDQALAGAPPLPEHHLLSAAGKLAGNTERLTERVTLDDPARLLAVQRVLTERVLALEFVAKVAGAATQGVNKLVHMQ